MYHSNWTSRRSKTAGTYDDTAAVRSAVSRSTDGGQPGVGAGGGAVGHHVPVRGGLCVGILGMLLLSTAAAFAGFRRRQVTLVLSRAKLTDVDVDRSQEFVQPTCQP